MIGFRVQASVAAEEIAAEAAALAKRCPRKLRDHGPRAVVIRPLRGEAVAVRLASGSGPWEDSAAGRRVVVSTDGGRLRERCQSEVPTTPQGRKRYWGEWREPKRLHIYMLDAEGRREREFLPVIDGTLGGADAQFMLLGHYLAKLEIGAADTLVVIADGAHWIWNRLGELLAGLGLAPGRWLEVVDFYPAVERLSRVASLCKRWSAAERQGWIRTQRRRLKAGRIGWVIEAIQELCKGRHSKAIRRERQGNRI